MELHPLAKAQAIRSAMAKSRKIKALGLDKKLSQDEMDEIVINLAQIKVHETGMDLDSAINGQEFYVNSLIKFSKLDAQQRFDEEYNKEIVKYATLDEAVDLIAGCM